MTSRSAQFWLLLTVLLIACGSGDDHHRVEGAVATQASELAASTTLSQALTGRVQSVPGVAAGGVIAAALTGDLNVEHNGSASYRIPLWVPEGVHGTQPSLALEYSSVGGRTYLGPKWRLSGLSAIVRCGQDLATDGLKRPVDFANGDTFCLDGERLIRTSGNAGGAGEFRTETNPFRKIRVSGVGIPTGIVSFEVFEPDGRICSYGRNASSRLDMNAPGGKIYYFAYHVDKVQDRYGNSILITYRKDYTYAAGTGKVQELFPATITWGATGNTVGQRSIKFVYQPANGYHPDDERRFISGYEIVGGERLTALEIYGPNGLGATPLVKKYNFTYTKPPSIGGQSHGLQRLTTISECDGNNVCKRPTTVTWEDGSNAYATKDGGDITVGLPNTSPLRSAVYRRLLVKDLNNDGLDDVIFRQFVASSTSPTGSRLGWVARRNVTTGNTVAFANGVALPGVDLSDKDPAAPFGAEYGDPIISDVDLDDYPDIFVSSSLSPARTTYYSFRQFCPVPGGLHGSSCGLFLGGFTGGTAIDDPLLVGLDSPAFSLADVTGDGYPEFVRPGVLNGVIRGFHWMNLSNTQSGDSALGTRFEVIDLDGDGSAEVVPNINQVGLSQTLMGAPSDFAPNLPDTPRWLLDLNGDGLLDIAWVGTDPNTISTRLSMGSGKFTPAQTTNLFAPNRIGPGWQHHLEYGARVVDYDLDGFDDLLLVDNGGETSPGVPIRTAAVVLLSNGAGGFVPMVTPVPIGDTADGPTGASCGSTPCSTPFHGYRTTATGDINGDGLPDVVHVKAGNLVVYLRQGSKPGVVKAISEGTGRRIDIGYAPVSDSTVYTKDPLACAGSNRLSCLTRARWVVRSTSVSGWLMAGTSVAQTTTYKYTSGLFDRFGRGFLGFKRRDIYGPGSRHVTTTYDQTTTRQVGGQGTPYVYPWVFAPITTTTDVDTPQGPQAHHRRVETFSYSADVVPGLSRFVVLPQGSNMVDYDCPSDGAGGCSGPLRSLGGKDEYISYDPVLSYNALGVPWKHTIVYRAADTDALQTDTQTNTFGQGFNATTWLMPITRTEITSSSTTVSPTDTETVTRTTKYTPDPQINAITGLPSGDAKTIELEPTGSASVRRLRTLVRDTRGRLTSVEERDVLLSSVYPSRTTTYRYDDADGVYVTRVINALGQTNRVWRHPTLGVVVETDDPNNLAAVATYDTFGRVLSETGLAGASASYTYADASNPATVGGVDMTVRPEGKATRQIKVHLDSFGRETLVSAPVDATRAVAIQSFYDGAGRLVQKIVKTGTTSSQTTVANVYDYTYDDLDRPLSDCHIAGDGLNRCTTKQYDGRTTTISDESGQVVTHIDDELGRPSVQRAALQTGTSDAKLTYGAFGLLRRQKLSDGTGQTDFMYDVLGRQVSSTRTGAGTLGTTYNALGDVVATDKRPVGGGVVETISYTYDLLGRPTLLTSTNLSRQFAWDKLPDGTAVQFGIGKLTQMSNGTASRVAYAYGSNGMKQSEAWEVSRFGGPLTSVGQASYFYDSQGRTDSITYPQNLGGIYASLTVQYTYDQYTGQVASVADIDNSATTLWSASSRNALGLVTSETMNTYVPGTTVSKATSYYSQNGQVNTATLSGTNGSSSLAYGYHSNLLPRSVSATGVGGAWTSTFDYDMLQRLTRWGSGRCCGGSAAIDVSYTYDSDGNLTRRQWTAPGAGENVGYSTAPAAGGGSVRTVQTNSAIIPNLTETYQADAWGRIFDTPSVALTYNPADEVTTVVEKANGQSNAIVRDALGQRLATTYGTSSSGSYLLTLMSNLYELRYTTGSNTYEERCRLRVAGKVVGDVVRTAGTASKTATFYLTDNVGSVVAEGSNNGVIAARARRDPFGNLTGTAGDAPYLPLEPGGANPDGTSRLGFAGHSRDNNWGLVDMNARFYSPRLGRFTAPDSVIGDPSDRRDYNPFAYVRNNPTMLTDSTGRAVDGCGGQQCGSTGNEGYSEAGRAGQQGGQPVGSDGSPRMTIANSDLADGSLAADMGYVASNGMTNPIHGYNIVAKVPTLPRHSQAAPSYTTAPDMTGPMGPTQGQRDALDTAAKADATNGVGGPPSGPGGSGAPAGKVSDGATGAFFAADTVSYATGKYGDAIEWAGKQGIKVAETADDVKAGKALVDNGGKFSKAAGGIQIVTGIAQFTAGTINNDPVAKTSGALSIGAGIVAIAIGGPPGWIIGGGIFIFTTFVK